MRVLLAFDKFKDSLTARQAGSVTARVLHELHPDWSIELTPMTDGGDGFVDLLTQSVGGEIHSAQVHGPRGDIVAASFGLVGSDSIPLVARSFLSLPIDANLQGKSAVVEMALASGLALLPMQERDPWRTSTYGTGEVIREAIAKGAESIILGVGGSATNDLGLGALSALGLRFYSDSDAVIEYPVPAEWPKIRRIGGSLPPSFPPLYIACDVTNPLLGEQGAATIYGPQKGLQSCDLGRMEMECARMASLLSAFTGSGSHLMNEPGAGAAGGISFGLMAAAGARILPGCDLVSAWLDLERKIGRADLIITGEGSFDESSSQGKGPGSVVDQALARGKTVHVFAGKIDAPAQNNMHLHAISKGSTPLNESLASGAKNLEATVRRIFSEAHSIL